MLQGTTEVCKVLWNAYNVNADELISLDKLTLVQGCFFEGHREVVGRALQLEQIVAISAAFTLTGVTGLTISAVSACWK